MAEPNLDLRSFKFARPQPQVICTTFESMPVDRKRKASDNESAISKLRRARSESTRISTRESSPIAATIAQPEERALRDRPRKTIPQSSKSTTKPIKDASAVNEAPIGDDNQFAALGENVEVQGNRIYERLEGSRLRVELSEGADCIVAGRYTLWVKNGSVAIMGAVLHASPTQHKIAASPLLSLPSIRAVYGPAEFEFGEPATLDKQAARSSTAFRPFARINTASQDLSYQVLGLDFSLDTPHTRRPRLLTLQNDHFKQVHGLDPGQAPCVVFGGTRLSESTTMARGVLNRMITARKQETELIFIDLSPSMPILDAPGMVSVALVQRPVLGTSLDRSCQQGVAFVRRHFVGPLSTELQPHSWFEACVKDLIHTAANRRQQNPHQPVLVNIGSNIILDESLVGYLWSTLTPTSIDFMDAPTPTATLLRFMTLSKQHGVPTRSLPAINENPHTARSHGLNMESYFNSVHDIVGNARYQGLKNEVETPETMLRYSGPGAEILALTSVDTALPPDNLHRAIIGLLAALMVVKVADMAAILERGQLRHCSTSRLPVVAPLTMESLQARRVSCLGLCYVTAIDIVEGSIEIKSPICPAAITAVLDQGQAIVLVVQPPTRGGNFAAIEC